MGLTLCPRCARHARRVDAVCPFCGAHRHAGAAALATAGVLVLAGCSSTVTEEPNAVGAYGVPPADAAAEETSDAADDGPSMFEAAYGPPPDAEPQHDARDAQDEDAWPMMDAAYAPPPPPKQ